MQVIKLRREQKNSHSTLPEPRHFPLRPLLMYSGFLLWHFGLFIFYTFRYAVPVVKRKTLQDFIDEHSSRVLVFDYVSSREYNCL